MVCCSTANHVQQQYVFQQDAVTFASVMTELVQENKLDREKNAVDGETQQEQDAKRKEDDSQQGWVEWITVHIFRI